MAIDNTTTVPKIVAAGFLAAYRKATIFQSRTNNIYRSLLGAYGNEVIINTGMTAGISDYTANANITYENADVGDAQTLQITKNKSWAVKFDDLNAAVSLPNVLEETVRETALSLALVVDADVRAAMSSGATAITAPAAIDMEAITANSNLNPLKLDIVHRIMDEALMPRAGRWMIISSYTAAYMQRIGLTNSTIFGLSQGSSPLINGSLGSFAGFNVYVSPGNATVNKSARTANEQILFGNDTACAFIDRVARTERLRLQNTFADAVRGLYQYGSKVLYPNRIFKYTAPYTKIDVSGL